jgi:hypothetical protein
MLELQHLTHCFPVRIELVLKGMLPAYFVFQRGDRLSFLQIGLFS